MRAALLIALAITAACSRRATLTPAYLTIHATAASCETLTMSDTGRVMGECRYTIEERGKMEVRRIEFRRVR